jgi:uncharacterized lipoprotein YmbA
MGRPLKPLAAVVSLIGLFLLAGCTESKPSRFYVLTPLAAGKPAHYPDGLAIGVGPVVIPQYLDRPQVVTRSSDNRLDVGEIDQWGGRLSDNVTRVLAENLSLLLATDRVSIYPWTDATAVGLQVTLDIVEFERGAGGAVTLSAFWNITDVQSAKILVTRRSTIVKNIDAAAKGAEADDATVAAMSDALATISQEIAATVKALPR